MICLLLLFAVSWIVYCLIVLVWFGFFVLVYLLSDVVCLGIYCFVMSAVDLRVCCCYCFIAGLLLWLVAGFAVGTALCWFDCLLGCLLCC